ncbi:MAG: hypothetical protein WCJ39_02660 [bacterium]
MTALTDDYIEYIEDSDVDSTIEIQPASSIDTIKVKNINIINLLNQTSFDGLKLDIE